jgi:hypothetical protein
MLRLLIRTVVILFTGLFLLLIANEADARAARRRYVSICQEIW